MNFQKIIDDVKSNGPSSFMPGEPGVPESHSAWANGFYACIKRIQERYNKEMTGEGNAVQ